ncbi:MAG TPA: hypothetical protein VK179_01820 [Bacteroidales bacterium]|nr:hypothetical protein [Bacteroidales bacterium]
MKNPVIALFLLLFCCTQKQADQASPIRSGDSALGIVVADTVIYDVAVVNHNPDDTWSTERLKNLHHELLLDNVFSMIAGGKAVAYDHTTGEKLTPGHVEKMLKSKEIDPAKIDMIQFKEIWYINASRATLRKEVISMVLGSQIYDNYGTFIGNKAIMRVELLN